MEVKTYHPNGKPHEVYFMNDKVKQGLYTSYYAIGVMNIQCNFDNDKINGPFKQWHPNGNLQCECNFVDGKKNGPFKQWDPNRNLQCECTYLDDLLHETYVWYNNKNGHMDYIYIYKNGKLDGPSKHYDDAGKITIMCTYIDGELNGEYKAYEKGKLIKKCNYKLGKLIGLYETWSIKGKPRDRIMYDDNGNKHGECVEYDEYGYTTKEHYVHGIQDGCYELYHDGKLSNQIRYRLGVKEGLEVSYYKGDFHKSYYKNGLQEGPEIYYFGGTTTYYYYHKGKSLGLIDTLYHKWKGTWNDLDSKEQPLANSPPTYEKQSSTDSPPTYEKQSSTDSPPDYTQIEVST